MAQCESCGMPLEGDGGPSRFEPNYCVHCQDQQTGQLSTRPQVRLRSVETLLKRREISRDEAEALVDTTMTSLPRWQYDEDS